MTPPKGGKSLRRELKKAKAAARKATSEGSAAAEHQIPSKPKAPDYGKGAWTDPLRFQQVEIGRNPTLGVQKRLYRAVLDSQLKPGDRILEIGSGRGWMQKHIVPEGLKKNWTETDMSELAMQQSEGQKRVRGSILSLPFKDGSLDAVVECACLDLFHPNDHKRIVEELHRVLKPGGKVISFQDAPPNPAIWYDNPKRSDGAQSIWSQDQYLELQKKTSDSHDRFSKAFGHSLVGGGFELVERRPMYGEGVFPQEARHSRFSEPTASLPPATLKAIKEAPAYMYSDGLFMPKDMPSWARPPPGHKVELFQGRLIVARKKPVE